VAATATSNRASLPVHFDPYIHNLRMHSNSCGGRFEQPGYYPAVPVHAAAGACCNTAPQATGVSQQCSATSFRKFASTHAAPQSACRQAALPYPYLDTRAGVSTPSLRASSCASMTTLMAFSVNRSNIAWVVCLLPRPAARVLRCTAACRVAGRTGLLTASTAFARLKPLNGCSLTAARCLPAMHLGVSGAVRWTDARIVGTPMRWVPRVSCIVLLPLCQDRLGPTISVLVCADSRR
jgi:hypothetical protein